MVITLDENTNGRLRKSAIWIRNEYQIPDDSSCVQKFEQEFNCTINLEESKITFLSEESFVWFMLKWY